LQALHLLVVQVQFQLAPVTRLEDHLDLYYSLVETVLLELLVEFASKLAQDQEALVLTSSLKLARLHLISTLLCLMRMMQTFYQLAVE